jgi:hypothetical protein
MGAITKVGRLHSRYDIARADSDAVTTVRLLAGAADEWELHSGRVRGARIQRTTSSLADSLNLAGVVYSVNLTAPVDHWLQLLLLAVPVAIDILDTQAF